MRKNRRNSWLEKRRLDRIDREKQKRIQKYRRFGQKKIRHSTMGMRSCVYAAGSALILALCIGISYAVKGKAAAVIGLAGILAAVCAGYGVRAALKGTKERDRNYITCKIGLVCNIIMIAGLSIIYIGGF